MTGMCTCRAWRDVWYRWAAWVLGEGAWKSRGRRSKPRPAEFPARVPVSWWVRLAVFLAARTQPVKGYTGIYNQPGLLWRQSDSEDVARAHRAGFRWGLLQLGGDNWGLLRKRLTDHGMPWGYWFHCRSLGDLQNLLQISREQEAPLVGINVEYELVTILPPDVIRREVEKSGYKGEVCTILLGWQGWVENGVHKGPDYTPIAKWPGLLEIFPQDAPAMWMPRDTLAGIVQHARALGLKIPMQLMATYDNDALGQPVPAWYDRTLVPSHVYTADDLDDKFEGWV